MQSSTAWRSSPSQLPHCWAAARMLLLNQLMDCCSSELRSLKASEQQWCFTPKHPTVKRVTQQLIHGGWDVQEWGVGWGGQMGPVMPPMLCYPHHESELWRESCSSVSTEFCTLHRFCSMLCASWVLRTVETEIWCFQQRWEQFPLHYHQKSIIVVLDFH